MKETIKEKMMNLVTISNDRIKEEVQMKNKRNIYMLNLISLVILSLTFISTTQAQSTSQFNPIAPELQAELAAAQVGDKF